MIEKYNYICPVCNKQRKLSIQTLNNHKEYLDKCYFCRRTDTTRINNLKKYGVICYSQTEAFKKRHKQTYTNMSEVKKLEIKEKRKLSNLKKFGVENNSKLESYRNNISLKNRENAKTRILKAKQTNLRKYNVENVSQIEEVKVKKEETNLKHCGQKYFAQTSDFQKTKKAKYTFANMYFDSKPELAFYIYCKDHNLSIRRNTKSFEYFFKDKKYYYFPDFEIDGKIYEIKGNQFLKKNGTWQNPFDHSQDKLYEAKHQCLIKNNVIILYKKDYQKYLEYVNQKFGEDFLSQFKR